MSDPPTTIAAPAPTSSRNPAVTEPGTSRRRRRARAAMSRPRVGPVVTFALFIGLW